jgi:hypothetical protein
MGLNLLGSCHWIDVSGDRNAVPSLPVSNPKPDNYVINSKQLINGYTILEVNYPDCTNYEGNKILVFKGEPPTGKLDPHFHPESKLVARFVPEEGGMQMAIKICEVTC